jgi:hypothetical protein
MSSGTWTQVIGLTLLAGLAFVASAPAWAAEWPNIIFILADHAGQCHSCR